MKAVFLYLLGGAMTFHCLAQNCQLDVKALDTNVIAFVLGNKIHASDRDQLTGLIFSRLLQQYVRENHIKATREEIETASKKIQSITDQMMKRLINEKEQIMKDCKNNIESTANKEAQAVRVKWIDKVLVETGKGGKTISHGEDRVEEELIISWKVNKMLFDQYGGRVAFQQAGPEPIDAYREFLKEQENRGAFNICDTNAVVTFWQYFTDDETHTWLTEKEGREAINNPWWLRQDDITSK